MLRSSLVDESGRARVDIEASLPLDCQVLEKPSPSVSSMPLGALRETKDADADDKTGIAEALTDANILTVSER